MSFWGGSMTEIIGQHDITEEVIAAQDQLYRLAYRLTGNREDANDLTQDTLLKALQYVCGFRGEAALKTWLKKILVNTFLTQKRKHQDHTSIALEYLPAPDWSANPENVVVKRELQWCIAHTLAHHLPERYAVALTLREFEGLPYKVIAQTMSISEGTAKVLVYRSRQAFRRHLERSGCYSYVRDYRCICDGVRDGLLPIKELHYEHSNCNTDS